MCCVWHRRARAPRTLAALTSLHFTPRSDTAEHLNLSVLVTGAVGDAAHGMTLLDRRGSEGSSAAGTRWVAASGRGAGGGASAAAGGAAAGSSGVSALLSVDGPAFRRFLVERIARLGLGLGEG
jgi:hypothetical protein